MVSESSRQQSASIAFITAYQYIWVGVVLALALRNLVCIILDRRRATQLAMELDSEISEKLDVESLAESVASRVHTPTRFGRFDSWMYHPVSARPWASGISPLRIFVVLFICSINIGFTLAISTAVRGPQSVYINTAHQFAMRCGIMALANAPPVFALMGRNGIVSFITGIDPQHLRFAHKTFGYALVALTLTHLTAATSVSYIWSGDAGIIGLYTMSYIQWGAAGVFGSIITAFFSMPYIRRRQYEIFIVTHVSGAIMILVGIQYHVPSLCAWTYSAIGFWAFERFGRIVQLFSLRLLLRLKIRSPIIRAHAELVHGAILLRVPAPAGGWSPGQYAYLRILDPSLLRLHPLLAFQAHPFTIANAPTSSELPEMLFVLRVRDGMTADLAHYLEKAFGRSSSLLVAVEGPYGASLRADRFEDVLLVCGGAGITHCQSILAGIIERGRTEKRSYTKRIELVWVVQHLEQADWIVQDLFKNVQRASAHANIALSLKIFVTRGPISRLPSPMSSSESLLGEKLIQGGRMSSLTGSSLDLILLHHETGPNTQIISGRAPTASVVRDFVSKASSSTAVVGKSFTSQSSFFCL
ncbi:hypothetical protein RQP46_009907 [Phenoliferia psychrophenolica]